MHSSLKGLMVAGCLSALNTSISPMVVMSSKA